PPVTAQHADIIDRLYRQLAPQLPVDEFGIRAEAGRVRRGSGSYYEPDLCVIPRAFVERQIRERLTELEVYDEPLTLVVEVWSPSTGNADVIDKVPAYQRRGDAEIWRIHPRERTVTVWQRQTDGSYRETRHTAGVVRPAPLPNVTIEIEALFAW
ncbi:MAG: Uma2 family endonuclease, partial [Dehalococcoidia bacterium]